MKRNFVGIAALIAGLALITSTAAADGITLALEGGAAVPLTHPQSDRFDVGGYAAVRPKIGLLPFLDVGPSVSLTALPSSVPGVDTGMAWGFGGDVRLKRPRDASNTDTGLAAVSPWLDAELQYVRTGGLDRAGVSIGAGLAFPLSDSRVAWAGPFVRYQDITQGNRVGFDNSDAHLAIIGLSLEFGGAKACDCERVAPPPAPAPQVIVRREPSPPPPVVQPEVMAITQIVAFKADSAVVELSDRSKIADVAKLLKDHPTWHVEIQGHASTEGPPEPYNTKLSQRRADAVLNSLKGQGIASDRMVAKGFGSSRPVASNATPAGRKANRRVEFKVDFIIKKDGGTK